MRLSYYLHAYPISVPGYDAGVLYRKTLYIG